MPTCKGWDWRFKNGGGYLAVLVTKDPEEIKAREDRFRVAIKPFIEDFRGMWEGLLAEILGRYENLKALDMDTATNIELLANFEESINTCRRMWEIHMYRDIVNRRKAEWKDWCQNDNPPMIMKEGYSVEEAMKDLVESFDPIALKVVVGTMPVPKPELKADLYAVSGSPGVAEGTVKVIWVESELSKIEKGDILVAPTTSPSWTPVFPLLNGVIVDRGASLSHAAIVGREFGIPVDNERF